MKIALALLLILFALNFDVPAQARTKKWKDAPYATSKTTHVSRDRSHTKVAKYAYGPKPRKSAHPGPTHKDSNYEEHGWGNF